MSRCNWHALRKRADFIRLQQQGQKWITPAFVIQTLAVDSAGVDDSKNSPEIGLTATKKLGSAVIRNRAKRRLRAVLDTVIGNDVAQGQKLVLIARSDVLTRDFKDLTKDLRWALRKLGISTAQ